MRRSAASLLSLWVVLSFSSIAAFGLVVPSVFGKVNSKVPPQQGGFWPSPSSAGLPAVVMQGGYSGDAVRVDVVFGVSDTIASTTISAMQIAVGWPVRAFRTVVWTETDTAGNRTETVRPPNIVLPSACGDLLTFAEHGAVHPRVIPLGLMWPEAAILLLIHSSAAGAAVLLTRLSVRRYRSARGRCIYCAYPVGGDICPECGRPNKPRHAIPDP